MCQERKIDMQNSALIQTDIPIDLIPSLSLTREEKAKRESHKNKRSNHLVFDSLEGFQQKARAEYETKVETKVSDTRKWKPFSLPLFSFVLSLAFDCVLRNMVREDPTEKILASVSSIESVYPYVRLLLFFSDCTL